MSMAARKPTLGSIFKVKGDIPAKKRYGCYGNLPFLFK
jgi:hypothetical protein